MGSILAPPRSLSRCLVVPCAKNFESEQLSILRLSVGFCHQY